MIATAVAHLWQSTVFALAAWLIVATLRTNRAEVRYWVWFAASVKFLIPFSLLVALGSLVPHRVVPEGGPAWVGAVEEFAKPLALPMETSAPGIAAATTHVSLSQILLALWACGFAVILVCWVRRWRSVCFLRRSATAVITPTVADCSLRVMSVPGLMEPGVFGIFRPVLLVPEGIVENLSPLQLEAILAHEFCHVRRKDNLISAIHMAVQAIFWFHPLTWWIGSRLVDERERACDEEVLRQGCKPKVYAESILTVCKLYLGAPALCVSAVTGSNLRPRIESIMRGRKAAELSGRKKLGLGSAAAAALLLPVVIGTLHEPVVQAQDAGDWQAAAGGKMSFDVASVKLSKGPFVTPSFNLSVSDGYKPTGGYFRADFPLWTYIQFAYKIWPTADESKEILARLPKWVTTDRYSIDARGPANATKDQMRLMVEALLAERFGMRSHFESREASIFALTLAGGATGPKLRPHSEGPPCNAADLEGGPVDDRIFRGEVAASAQNFPPTCGTFAVIRKSGGALMLSGSRNATMGQIAASLAGVVGEGRPVIDRTGLSGRFDFTLEWAPETAAPASSDTGAGASEPAGPTARQALRDQLGLKLESTKASVRILVIDHVERPTEN